MPLLPRYLISSFVVVFYLSTGLFLIFAKTLLFTGSLNQQRIVGTLFVLFAIYKGYRLYKVITRQKKNEGKPK